MYFNENKIIYIGKKQTEKTKLNNSLLPQIFMQLQWLKYT